MKFFAVNGTRPSRLSEQTRLFAYESMHHQYGRETWETPGVAMDDIEGFGDLTWLKQYDLAVERIVQTAPIRICNGEKISGAATLGPSISHCVPATFRGKLLFGSVSHLTIDFETVLKQGVNALEEQVHASLTRFRGTEKEPFLESCLHCIRCLHVWHQRYLQALADAGYEANVRNLQRVPFAPATNFREAVQSLWFTFAFVRLCGNWPGIGRIDWLLGDYLEQDLADGVLTEDEAREILAHFFIKGCEWIKGGDCVSGDAQHYQNILLGGTDANGADITNTVTYLVLDVLEELGISDFPTTVRIGKMTPPKLLRRVAEVIRFGGGVLAVYNEGLIIDSLLDYGYPPEEAWKFANDGCWEIQIPGKTFFSYLPFDALRVLQQNTLENYGETVCFADFESLYRAFIRDLQCATEEVMANRCANTFVDSGKPAAEWRWKTMHPCTVVSLFEQGCIENGRSYWEGGPIYKVVSPHIGGLPDVVNSLYAIQTLVFGEKKVSFGELMQILKNDWQDHEDLRLYALNHIPYFGNDHDAVDLLAKRIVDDFAEICREIETKNVYKTPAGVSTFGRQLEWHDQRLATPYGKKKNSILAGNFSPTPGTDKAGATAIIRSYCKSDLKQTVSGAALDIKLLPSAVNGENGIEAIIALICGFTELGGHFMQLDIADTQLLKDAQEHPEEYQNLSVRVSGWNARFVTLNKAWQDMIIAQTGSDL